MVQKPLFLSYTKVNVHTNFKDLKILSIRSFFYGITLHYNITFSEFILTLPLLSV